MTDTHKCVMAAFQKLRKKYPDMIDDIERRFSDPDYHYLCDEEYHLVGSEFYCTDSELSEIIDVLNKHYEGLHFKDDQYAGSFNYHVLVKRLSQPEVESVAEALLDRCDQIMAMVRRMRSEIVELSNELD